MWWRRSYFYLNLHHCICLSLSLFMSNWIIPFAKSKQKSYSKAISHSRHFVTCFVVHSFFIWGCTHIISSHSNLNVFCLCSFLFIIIACVHLCLFIAFILSWVNVLHQTNKSKSNMNKWNIANEKGNLWVNKTQCPLLNASERENECASVSMHLIIFNNAAAYITSAVIIPEYIRSIKTLKTPNKKVK